MDIKQLKFLIALDETRHFGQAAARCHVTPAHPVDAPAQPAKSWTCPWSIAASASKASPHPVNGCWRGPEQCWRRTDGLQAEAAACRGNLVGTLRLGVVPLSSFDPLALMQQLHKEHPSLRFELSALSSEQILEQLASNRLDLGVSYLERLDNERFRVRWPWAKRAWACSTTSGFSALATSR